MWGFARGFQHGSDIIISLEGKEATPRGGPGEAWVQFLSELLPVGCRSQDQLAHLF